MALGLLLGLGAASLCQAAGTAAAWGDDNAGQVSLIPPAASSAVMAVAAGGNHSLALLTNGAVLAWGLNTEGQTNVPPGLSNVIAIAAGSADSLALTAQGTVVTWGQPITPPAGLSNVVGISAGAIHALAVEGNGTVVAWGDDSYGQIDVPDGLTNAVAVAAGGYFSLVLRADGTVVAWGDNTYGQTNVPPLVQGNTLAIAAGSGHCLAIQQNGTVVAWGRNDSGQATVPANLSNVVAVAGGALHSLALTANGTLAGWGDDTYGQSDTSPIQMGYCAVAAGDYHSLTIRGNGSPVILLQPASQTVFVGATATLNTLAAGDPPIAFQWQRNTQPITGATSSSYSLPNIQATNTGAFTVSVSNFMGITFSQPAALSVLAIPTNVIITKPPQDQTVNCGEAANFQVTATGPKPLTYQWLFQNVPISNATNASLSIPSATDGNAGSYGVAVSAPGSSATSRMANLTVEPAEPTITSPLTTTALQGQPFSYTITGLNNPTVFKAEFLPPGLTLNPTTGAISGTNTESGTFYVGLSTLNPCGGDFATLGLTVTAEPPTITSLPVAFAFAGSPFTYAITASGSPTNYAAANLAPGLILDPITGVISGTPAYGGTFTSTISANNTWGVGSSPLTVNVVNGGGISGLSIVDVHTNYSKPYLVDIQFGLRDNNDPTNGSPIAVDPSLLSVTAYENWAPVDPNETAFIVQRGILQTLQNEVALVLDFSSSISSTALNGDSYGDGISDAAHAEINCAELFVTQQPANSLISVYEFHRKDVAPNLVIALTNATAAYNAIAGVWTNYVNYDTSSSRCWDALSMAIGSFGRPNLTQLHSIVFVSDGNDNSSTTPFTNLLIAASNSIVQVNCVGFGEDINSTALQQLASVSGGLFLEGQTAADVAAEFGQIDKAYEGTYHLRWLTTSQSSSPTFMPSFSVTYDGITAYAPTNPWWVSNYTLTNITVDTTTTPPTTNTTTVNTNTNVTNFVYFSWYKPATYAGNVNIGLLDLQPNGDLPSGVSLYASYLPENIRQFHVHYRLNWPGVVTPATNLDDLLYGWTAAPADDGSNGTWLLLSSPDPTNANDIPTVSIPWGSWGSLMDVQFRDLISSNAGGGLTAFSFFTVDTNIYATNIPGYFGQTMTNSLNGMTTNFPVLPLGTPAAWLVAHGFTVAGSWTNNETQDTDNDGMLNWQEYQANTDPNNPKSNLKVLGIDQSELDGRWQLSFSSALNRTYQVQATTNFLSWRVVADGLEGTGTNMTVSDTMFVPSAQTFYRILVY